MRKFKFLFMLISLVIFTGLTACENETEEGDRNGEDTTDVRSDNTLDMDNGETDQTSDADIPDPETFEKVPPEVKEQLATVVEEYLTLKDALVNSNGDDAQFAAGEVENSTMDINMDDLPEEQRSLLNEEINRIREYSRNMANTADVEEQRSGLEDLSKAVYTLAKAFDVFPETLYYQFCPMANDNEGAYWVSNTKEIRNPYFGEPMMNCGSVKETLN